MTMIHFPLIDGRPLTLDVALITAVYPVGGLTIVETSERHIYRTLIPHELFDRAMTEGGDVVVTSDAPPPPPPPPDTPS